MNQVKESSRVQGLLLALWVGVGMFVLGGCTPEKAAALRNAAVLFRSDANTAVQGIRELMDAEIAPPQRSDAAKTDDFVKNIMALPKTYALTATVIEQASDPNSVKLSAQGIADRDATFEKLQAQYGAFAAMFDDLERGSFLAKDKVAKTKQYAVALTSQMVNMTKSFASTAPQLVQERTAIITKMNKVRGDPTLSADQQRQQLAELKESWEKLMADESALQQGVVEKCLRAASSGQAVLQMIEGYNKFSVDDLSKMGEAMLTTGEQISGRNLSSLKGQNEQILAFLNSNPDYKAFLQTGLDGVSDRVSAGVVK